MKISKSKIKHISQIILSWTFINLAFNLIGLWISKLLNEADYTYIESIGNEFVKPLVIQSVLFGICLSIAVIYLKNKKLYNYFYVFVQFVIFHGIFFLNLKIHHGIHFETTFNNLGLRYLSYSGQYLIDVLYLYFPINGNFDNGAFMPGNIGTFYLHWILLNLVYYVVITWISIQVAKFFFENNTEIHSKPQIENKTESEP